MPLQEYLGALHEMEEISPGEPSAPRGLTVSNVGYTRAAALRARAETELGRTIPAAVTLYACDKEWGEEGDSAALFNKSCASHLATLLFLARVARPGISTAVRRLCSEVSRSTTVRDSALLHTQARAGGSACGNGSVHRRRLGRRLCHDPVDERRVRRASFPIVWSVLAACVGEQDADINGNIQEGSRGCGDVRGLAGRGHQRQHPDDVGGHAVGAGVVEMLRG